MIFIIVLFILISICVNSINTNIQKLNSDSRVASMKEKNIVIAEIIQPMYKTQLYDHNLENYFMSDIYADLPNDQMITAIERDYFKLFELCINSILNNKNSFQEKWQQLNNPQGLQYKFYIPTVKFAKYSLDYEKYLQKTSLQNFRYNVESIYPHFEDNEKYFISLNTKKCTKDEHILFLVKRAIDLYFNFKNEVNNCLQFNKCDHKLNIIKQENKQKKNQCKL
jgi:hypothetical protein